LTQVAFACSSSSGFTEPEAVGNDLHVGRALEFLSAFPGALLSLGSATVMASGDLVQKFETAASFYNAAGLRGARASVQVAFHPSSHHNTLLRTPAEYDRIIALTDPALVGWVPDTGHIIRGGHNMLDTLLLYRDRIRYLDLKDVDAAGTWTMLGAGACNTLESGKAAAIKCKPSRAPSVSETQEPVPRRQQKPRPLCLISDFTSCSVWQHTP
jgi:inosose dehydratase